MRTKAKVDGNHVAVVDALRAIGCSVQSLAAIGNGCPDILVGYRGRNLLLEIKDGSLSPSRRALTPDQCRWHEHWRGDLRVVSDIEQAMSAVLNWKQEPVRETPLSFQAVAEIVTKRVGPLNWGECRASDLISPRRWFCWLARKAGHSAQAIGRCVNRDHGTILHHCNRAEELIAREPLRAAIATRLLADLQETVGFQIASAIRQGAEASMDKMSCDIK